MFERFTDQARRAVVLGQEEALTRGHHYVGTEHLLLGLIRGRENVVATALEALGIRLEDVRRAVEEIIGSEGEPPFASIPFTSGAKKALDLSLTESMRLGHQYVGAEHLLLGLIREDEGVAAQVLIERGADLTSVRLQVEQGNR